MYGSVLIMISALGAGVIGVVGEARVTYTVRQVHGVPDGTFFTCRLGDYAWPTAARFSVRLRDVQAAADPNTADAARRFLYERLTNARQVRLHHVEDRGYFRLIADVRVDGSDIAEEMADYGLVRRVRAVEPPAAPDERAAVRRYEPVPVQVDTPSALPAVLSAELLRQRFRQTVDLSDIHSETTLQEALRILSSASEPRLPLLILWNDLEHNAFVERDTPIGIEGFGRIRLDKALELILRAVSPSETRLLVVAEGGVLTIATEHAGLIRPRAGVYPAADILAVPSEDRSDQTMGTGGAAVR